MLKGETGGQPSRSQRLSGSNPLIQDREVRGPAHVASTVRVMRVLVTQGRYATCVARRGTLRRIIWIVYHFVSAATRGVMWRLSVHYLHQGQFKLLLPQSCTLPMVVRGRLTPRTPEDELFSGCGRGQGGTRCCCWYVFIYIYVDLFYVYTFVMLLLSTFLVNYALALVMLDSRASQSFVSTSFLYRIMYCTWDLGSTFKGSYSWWSHNFRLLVYTGIVYCSFSV